MHVVDAVNDDHDDFGDGDDDDADADADDGNRLRLLCFRMEIQ